MKEDTLQDRRPARRDAPPALPPPGPTLRILLLLALVLFGAWVRWKDMDRPFLGLHAVRECDTASLARNYYEKGIDILHPVHWWDVEKKPFRGVPELPLFPALEAAVHHLVGFHEHNGRILNLVLTVLSFFLFFRLVERWSGTWTALAALLALDLSPLHAFFSTAVTRHGGMEQSFMLGSLLLWDAWCRTGRKRLLLPWALVCGTGLCVTPPTALLAPVYLGMAALRGRLKEVFRPAGLAAGLLCLALPAAWFAWVTRTAGGFPASMYQPKGNLRAWTSPSYWVRWLDPEWFRVVGEMALLSLGTWAGTVLAASALLLRRPRNWLAPPALWTLAGAAYFAADSYVVTGFLHHYYFMLWVPALCWLAGSGLTRAAALLPRGSLPALAVLALLYGADGFLEGLPRVEGWYRLAPCRVVDPFDWDRQVPAGDLVVFANLPNDVIYRARRKGWILFLEGPEGEKELARLLAKGARWVLLGKRLPGRKEPLGLTGLLAPGAPERLHLEPVEPKGPLGPVVAGAYELWHRRR